MGELMGKDDFRVALEDAIKGREAKNASFSQAWASGLLQRHHFARWAENHYHYVGPFADYLGYIYANTPDHATDAKDFLLQNMYEEELSDIRHTDLLIRFAEACGTTRERVTDPRNMNAVTRGLQGWCYSTAFRQHFAVATAARVRGIGRNLMRRFLQEARRRGRRRVTLEVAKANERAIQFFSTQGFKPVCRLAAYYGARYDGLRMTRDL